MVEYLVDEAKNLVEYDTPEMSFCYPVYDGDTNYVTIHVGYSTQYSYVKYNTWTRCNLLRPDLSGYGWKVSVDVSFSGRLNFVAIPMGISETTSAGTQNILQLTWNSSNFSGGKPAVKNLGGQNTPWTEIICFATLYAT